MTDQRCDRCGGQGALRVDEPECNGGRTMEPCDRCGGTGQSVSADTTDIVLQTRYDALAREVQRVRNDRDATRAELATLRAEARAMRVALGLDHGEAPAAPARNFGG